MHHDAKRMSISAPTRDHLWPKCDKPTNAFVNMVAMHRLCNDAKGSRNPTPREILAHQEAMARLPDMPVSDLDQIIADVLAMMPP